MSTNEKPADNWLFARIFLFLQSISEPRFPQSIYRRYKAICIASYISLSLTHRTVFQYGVEVRDITSYFVPISVLPRGSHTDYSKRRVKKKCMEVLHVVGNRDTKKSDTYLPILSTSSISTSGFSVPVFLRHCASFPGMAPTYVRRWPLISATSVMPPTEKRKYLRLRARAMDRAVEIINILNNKCTCSPT